MAHLRKLLSLGSLLALLVALCLSGCVGRRSRLMEERAGLLHERDQLQQPWQPQTKHQARQQNETEEQLTPTERMQKIDERVAEIDAQLLEIN